MMHKNKYISKYMFIIYDQQAIWNSMEHFIITSSIVTHKQVGWTKVQQLSLFPNFLCPISLKSTHKLWSQFQQF